MPIRIAIVSPGSFAAASSRSSSVERVIDEMSRRLPEPFRVTVFSRRLKGLAPRKLVGSVTHRRVRAASRSTYIRYVLRNLRAARPDVIQLENRPLLVPLFRRRFPATSLVLSLHSTTFIDPRVYKRRVLQTCFDQANHIAVNSEFLAQWIQARWRVPDAKLHVCYPGVDTRSFASRHESSGFERRAWFRQKLGLDDRKIILFMGRLVPIKGVHHLLAAMPCIAAEHDDAMLVICGSARYGSDRLTSYVRKLHQMGRACPRHVRFVPFVPHDSVPLWYQAADIFAAPSAAEEAFGLVNAESLACGTAVVSTQAGGIVEIVRHGENGLLLAPSVLQEQLAPVLSQLLADSSLRESLGRRGAKHVRARFTWEQTAASYAALYSRTVPRLRSHG